MGSHIARKTVQQMIHAGRNIKGARVNVLGLTFKEDVPDLRNSKVVDIIRELHEFGVETYVHDPAASKDDALHEYGIRLCEWEDLPAADATIVAVAHKRFLQYSVADYVTKIVPNGCLIDVKAVFDPAEFQRAGLRVWRL
jgi:UDP-N-acetyl-D-galactosamine dehydrogenase